MMIEYEQLRTAMNAIHQQDATGLLAAFQVAIDNACDEVLALPHDERDTDAKAWRRAAIASKQILRSHSDDVKAEWLEAYAGLPPMEWPPGSG